MTHLSARGIEIPLVHTYIDYICTVAKRRWHMSTTPPKLPQIGKYLKKKNQNLNLKKKKISLLL